MAKLSTAQTLALLLVGAALRSATARDLVVAAESPTFTLDTRPAGGKPTLLVTAESPVFTLNTHQPGGNSVSGAFTVRSESAVFSLDTRMAKPIEDLIVQAVSPAFEVNTMWLGIRRTSRVAASPVELYWPTNAPGFHPQSALQSPSAQWLDVTNTVSESGGFYRALLSPEEVRYFRLKL